MRSRSVQVPGRLSVAFALATAASLLPVAAWTGQALARPVATVPPDGIITGPARIIDGDTIDIAGTRIRLEGIDAPEAGQTCQTASGEAWDCGTEATKFMVSMTRGHDVECHGQGLDKYGRLLATCYAADLDVNAEMVLRGYAWAFVRYSKVYVAKEAAARSAHAGIWQGYAQPAWEYRAAQWTANLNEAKQAAPNGCAIKGNVSRSGQVYHMPWSPWYAKVSMALDKGKRWFCSEAEALAAGWRPAIMRQSDIRATRPVER